MIKRNEKILKRKNTALLIIDIQERILGVMQNPEGVVTNTVKLINIKHTYLLHRTISKRFG